MSRFQPEPEYEHGNVARTGVLLINLGTPDAPTARAVRPYLKQFLSDPRVVEIPRVLWWLILNLFILPTRAEKSAKKYASIWEKDGSPLRLHTIRQAKLLQGYLVHAGHPDIPVEYAMRYGNPSIESALIKLKSAGVTRLLVTPLYPQYAASSTASAFDAVASAAMRIRNLPELRFVRSFHDRPEYIRALGQSIYRHWQVNGRPDKLLMSFHGVPRFTLDKGDPYYCECHKTARMLSEYLCLKPEQYVLTFQSRFGRTEWVKPYTSTVLRTLPKEGVRVLDVVCPGFVSDCLETLEEIAIEGRTTFLSAGGKDFRYIPCLNEDTGFIDALRSITTSQMQDWLAIPPPTQEDQSARAALAKNCGAS
jgi:protoporphyrin/coproporphyrin ferrochelatase